MTAPANLPCEAYRPVTAHLIDAAGLVGRR